MKRWHILSVLGFFLPLFVLGVLSLSDADPTVSRVENRALTQKPALTLRSIRENTFTSSFENYYADTFPFREALISVGMKLRKWYHIPVGGGSTVIPGDFDLGTGEAVEDSSPPPQASPSFSPPSPSPGTSAPVSEPTPDPSPTPEVEPDLNQGGYLIVGDRIMHMSYTNEARCRDYAAMLNRLQDALPGNRIISMVLPNSYPFYAPPSHATKALDQKSMIEKLYAMYDARIVAVDAYTPIEAHKDEYLYFRSDHHWTARGAYWAYTGLCDALEYEPTDIDSLETFTYEGFVGSFYREVAQYPQAQAVKDNPDSVECYLPDTPYTAYAYKDGSMTDGWKIPMVNTSLSPDNGNKYVAFTNGDQPVIHATTGAGNGRSIVVIKESFGNALIPWLLPHYEDIYVLDYRKFNRNDLPKLKLADFVADNGIDDILLASYCYVPNEKNITGWIGKLLP